MKIVHIIYALNTGGTENMLVDIASEQAKTEDVSIIIVNNLINENIAEAINSNVGVYRINRKPGSRLPWKIIRLNLLLKKLNPDVIHCHNHTMINLIKMSLKSKIYLTVHGIGWDDINFKKYNKLFAISERVKNDILSKGKYKVQVVYNGINTEKIKQKNWSKEQKMVRLLQIGRLVHEKKGHHILLKALSRLERYRPDIHFKLDFIGEGPSRDYLIKLVKENNLKNNVNFLGNKSRDYVYSNICNYDLLVQPSIYEGFGLTVAEAMAAKVPVLVSDIDGPMEIIENGKYGNYFESCNTYECFNKIIDIIDNYNRQKAIVENAYIHCLNNFSINKTASNYINKYGITQN
jgi:glycosyltransferase involved in cell wall biosynthesis